VYLLFTWQAGKFVADLLASKRMPRFLAMAAIGLVLTRSLVYGFSLDVLLIRDSRYTAEAWMAQNLPKVRQLRRMGLLTVSLAFRRAMSETINREQGTCQTHW